MLFLKRAITLYLLITYSCLSISQENIKLTERKLYARKVKGYELISQLDSSFWYQETKQYLRKYKPQNQDSSQYYIVYGFITEVSPLLTKLIFSFQKEEKNTKVWITAFNDQKGIDSNTRLSESTSKFILNLNQFLRRKEAVQRLEAAEDSLLFITKKESKILRRIDFLTKEIKRKDDEVKRWEKYLEQSLNECQTNLLTLDTNSIKLEKIKVEVEQRKEEIKKINKEIKEFQ